MDGVVLGEGWGCAHGALAGDVWQCWEAGPRPQAFTVPWLRGGLRFAPDRICELATPELAFRCWQRPRPGDVGPHELPASWEWLNPHHAGWEDAYKRGDRVGGVVVGGTFACLQTTKNEGVFCLGDDRFGQLGSSSVPGPDADGTDPAFVRGLWPAMWLTAGTWHACALAAPRGMGEGGYTACWGRGDAGQLGGPAPDTCTVDGQAIACARHPVRGPAVPGMSVVRAGDLYTCVTTREGIKCWGANRDAFFGVPGSCPESLRSAWPTLAGPVAAPKAACSATPVPIPGVSGFEPSFSAFPRGLCFGSHGGRRCIGGIVDTPRKGGVHGVALSPGSDASACGLRDGGAVVCWGDGYSPSRAPDAPVTIAFAPAAPAGEAAILSVGDPNSWAAGCLVRRGCEPVAHPAPPCARDLASRPLAEIVADAKALTGQVIHARGRLGVGWTSHSLVGCPHQCCNGVSASVVLGAGDDQLGLTGLGCAGDDSAICCNAPAFGQTVVASGRLQAATPGVRPGRPRYALTDITLCTEAASAARAPR